MLQAIRERLIGWILWLVIGVVVVPFAFWGVESFRGGGGDPVVVKVGSERIRESQVRLAYERRYRQLQQLMGDSFRPDQINAADLRQRVVDDLVQESSLRQYAAQTGYRTPDSVLLQNVESMPAFQENGKFSVEAYRERLSREGYTPARFESEFRDSLTLDQMRGGVTDTAFVTNAELAASYRLAGQQRSLSYAIFELSRFEPEIKIEDAQVQKQYDEHKSEYMAPERVKLAYLELSLDKLPKAASPGEDALKAIYEAEKATRFTTAEEREVRHILINFGADKAASKKHAEELLAKLKAGADFAQLAKSESADTGSKTKGGDLGWIKRGQMVPKFEQAVFGMKKGELDGPVETEFGWHIIRLDDVRPQVVRPFEDKSVQQEVLELYQRKEAEKHFQDDQDRLEQLAFENPASLDAAAKALNLQVQNTDWFGRAGGEGIAANAGVKQAAFSDEVLKNGDNSKPLQIAPGDVVVIRKAAYEAPRQKTFEEVASLIRTQLKDQAAREKAKEAGRAMQESMRAGASPQDAAKKAGVELKYVGLIKRDSSDADRSIVDTLFKLPRPQNDKPTYQQVVLGNGNVALVILNAVKDGDLSAANPDDLKREQAKLRDLDAGREFEAMRSEIADSVKVKVYKSAAELPDEAAP